LTVIRDTQTDVTSKQVPGYVLLGGDESPAGGRKSLGDKSAFITQTVMTTRNQHQACCNFSDD